MWYANQVILYKDCQPGRHRELRVGVGRLLYNLLYDKTTTNRPSGVRAYYTFHLRPSTSDMHARTPYRFDIPVAGISGLPYSH